MAEQEPNVEKLTAFAEELDESLANAVRRWYLASDWSQGSWEEMLLRKLEDPMVEYLVRSYANSLRVRGLRPVGEDRVRELVREAIENTEDIRLTLLTAPHAITAAFSWETVVSRLHQNRIIQSLTRKVQTLFKDESVAVTPGFTGRKMWKTYVPYSRHRHLDGEIREIGETFEVAPGLRWPEPRWDPQNGNASSGCLCQLLYEFVNEDGSVEWR